MCLYNDKEICSVFSYLFSNLIQVICTIQDIDILKNQNENIIVFIKSNTTYISKVLSWNIIVFLINHKNQFSGCLFFHLVQLNVNPTVSFFLIRLCIRNWEISSQLSYNGFPNTPLQHAKLSFPIIKYSVECNYQAVTWLYKLLIYINYCN